MAPGDATQITIGITGIDHVGIAVPDLDAAIAFHTDVLGGRLAHREENHEQGVSEAMIAYDSGAQVQLLAPLTPESTIARFLDRSGPGLQQLAYRVPDAGRATDAVRAAGLRVLYDEPRRGTAGSKINFIHPKDTGGVLVELVEPAAPAPPHAAAGVPEMSATADTLDGVASTGSAASGGTMTA